MLEIDALDLQQLAMFMNRGQLFAVLDACDAPAVPLLCDGLGAQRAVSLYRGEAEEEFADIAPYLIHVYSAELLDWISQFSVTDGWGIFMITPQPLEELRTHLRKFLKVLGPEGKRMYFRFYDPRVLEMFLPVCDSNQLIQFFGLIKGFATMNPTVGVRAIRRSGTPVLTD